MNERELAHLLRHIDDDVTPDAAETDFRMWLRADLDATLGRDGPSTVRLVPVNRSPRRTRNAALVAAAALITVLAGALIAAGRPADRAPASPSGTSAPATTTALVPVLDPPAACARFRASNIDELLESVIPEDLTVAELNDAVDAIEVLLTDVDAAPPSDPFRPVLVQVRNAVQEAARLLDVDERAGARAALELARTESRTRLDGTRFARCFDN